MNTSGSNEPIMEALAPEEAQAPVSPVKKILNITVTVAVWVILAFAIGIMIFTIFSVNTFDKPDTSVFGYRFFIVQSDSMAATHFNAGDLIVTKEVDVRELKEGEVITFWSQNEESYGETVTHMIREVKHHPDGSIGFVTYGTTTDVNDEAEATVVYGRYQTHFPGIGHFFAFLKTVPGYIICILIPFLLLILYQGISCVRLFLRYRKEQNEELEAEKAKVEAEKARIEAERAETKRMMEELMALKAQMANQSNGETAPPAAEPSAPEAPAEPPKGND